MNPLLTILSVGALSAVPFLELRAGIPFGLSQDLDPLTATIAATVGNLALVPVSLYWAELLERTAERFAWASRAWHRLRSGADRHIDWVQRYGLLGLAVFVVLPAPGTGIFSGAVLARVLGLSARSTSLGLSLSVAFSGLIFGLAAAGVLKGLRYLLDHPVLSNLLS